MSRQLAKKPQSPKRNYLLPNEESQPKKYTVMLYPQELKMLEELESKYNTNKAHILRKGIEVLFMNANSAVYWTDTK